MHEQYLLAALEQAWLGRGQCAPNPAVGAVAIANDSIIAQAFHSGAGSAHAEKKLLEQLPEDCSHITIYVTLEPCNHWGKTPPCTDALISKRVKRVVYGYQDPNPLVSKNDTTAQLREHGIDVIFFPMPEITLFYRSYRYWLKTKRPWVTVKIAQTFDGKIAGPLGERVTLSNQLCADFTHRERQHTDVILTTAATINRDNPALNVRREGIIIDAKPIAILDSKAQVNPEAQVFKTAKKCLIYQAHAQTSALADTYRVGEEETGLNLEEVLFHLGSLGFHDVWVEAGARLFHALHHASLVQTTYLYLVPQILGDSALSLYTSFNLFEKPYQLSWQALGDNMVAKFEWSEYV